MESEELFDAIIDQHFDVLLNYENDQQPGLYIFRVLKETKTVNGKPTNCELLHLEYGGKGWEIMAERIEASTIKSRQLLDTYMKAPEKYIFCAYTLAHNESATFTNFHFRVYDHDKKQM